MSTNQKVVECLNKVIGLLEEVTYLLREETEFKPMSETVPLPTLEQKLAVAGLEVNLLEISENQIKPKKFLGDIWGKYNDTLRNLGYKWVRAGQDSHWVTSGEQVPQRQQFQIRDPMSPATDKQKWKLDQIGVNYDSGITKGEAHNLIDHHTKQR